jgi:hypothetical protein
MKEALRLHLDSPVPNLFYARASDIAIFGGCMPEELVTDVGNGMPFVKLPNQSPVGWCTRYRQLFAVPEVVLYLYNDC